MYIYIYIYIYIYLSVRKGSSIIHFHKEDALICLSHTSPKTSSSYLLKHFYPIGFRIENILSVL